MKLRNKIKYRVVKAGLWLNDTKRYAAVAIWMLFVLPSVIVLAVGAYVVFAMKTSNPISLALYPLFPAIMYFYAFLFLKTYTEKNRVWFREYETAWIPSFRHFDAGSRVAIRSVGNSRFNQILSSQRMRHFPEGHHVPEAQERNGGFSPGSYQVFSSGTARPMADIWGEGWEGNVHRFSRNHAPNVDEEIAKHNAILEVLKAKKTAQEPQISKPNVTNPIIGMDINEES